MAYYNVRDWFGHWVKPRSAKGDPCPHSCCRGQRKHPANLPPTLRPKVLRALSDNDLADHYGKHGGCEKCRNQIERELERRDRADRARKATGARNKARALERHEEVERQWLDAEAATRGNMVNARGRAAGISERSLFTGSEDRALRYASAELKNYWLDHPRPTAASMSGNYRVRRNAAAGSNLGREQARVVRLPSGRRVSVDVKRKAA